MVEVQEFRGAFDRIKKLVMPDRIRKAEEGKDIDGNVRPHHKGS